MTINLNRPVTDLDGATIKPPNGGSLGKLLAMQISSTDLSPAIKWLDWAILLWNEKPLSLDDSDYDLFVKMVEECKNLTVLSKGQILKALRDSKLAGK